MGIGMDLNRSSPYGLLKVAQVDLQIYRPASCLAG